MTNSNFDPIFLGEQSGEAESALTDAVVPLLENEPSVECAFLLAAILGPDEAPSVVLGIVSPGEVEALALAILDVFGEMFEEGNLLHVMFLSPESVAEVEEIAKPIYRRAQGS